MALAIFIHDPEGCMSDATVIGPFSTWKLAERFRDEHYPYEGNLEGIVVELVGARNVSRHPTNSPTGRY